MSWNQVKTASVIAALALAGIQFVRPARTNPRSHPNASFEAVVQPPPGVTSGLKRACYDCHSNETVWPWYSEIAPVSWLIARDVDRGRAHLNFSDWTHRVSATEPPELADLCEEVKAGSMPLRSYSLLHPAAVLTNQEIAGLCSLSTGQEHRDRAALGPPPVVP
jgi:heme-binding protein